MRTNISTLLPLLLCLSVYACQDVNKAKSFEQMVDRISGHYIDDARVDRLEIRHKSTFQGLLVEGFTTIPAAYDSVQTILSEGGFVVANNNFRLLPDAKLLEGKTAGIINVSVANLRSKPGHSQELATQALLGTPIEVLDYQNGWYLVRTPDRYLAWLEPGAFVAMTPDAASSWLDSELRVYVDRPAEASTTPDSEDYVTDLIAGGVVLFANQVEGDKTLIALPDGEEAWIENTGLYEVPKWFQPDTLKADYILRTAELLKGRPYLWGGTSFNAMDCSGFTKMAYYINGFVIPRDASQQVHAGEEVELTDDFGNLKAGDLLFFGRFRDDGSEKITHVGFYTGNGRFLHSGADNGRIREQSLRPGDDDFAEHRLKSLLRARRLRMGTPGVVPVGDAFQSLLE